MKPLVERFFAWCDAHACQVLDDTPIAKAIGYARNQRVGLQRFLDDARLPICNNISERGLRREVTACCCGAAQRSTGKGITIEVPGPVAPGANGACAAGEVRGRRARGARP